MLSQITKTSITHTNKIQRNKNHARRYGKFNLQKDYGSNVFGADEMLSRLPTATYKRLRNEFESGKSVDARTADSVAHALKEWALEKGATHYTHWFQPLTGGNAEKHDTFIQPTWNTCAGSEISTAFSGELLVGGEPDASSFPSGGLRETHEARGYTVWDPQTPIFIREQGDVKTVTIPTLFYSWTGDALDRKIPELRSQVAIENALRKVLKAIDETGHKAVFADSGPEQEYFLISKDLADKRPDLIVSGRTLQGASPSKGQELSDHYFGSPPDKALACIEDFEQRAWKLGIPITTRHQEVAPNQFEVAPVFGPASVAADLNMLVMSLLKETALDHDLVCLLHEKPFAGVNGSGKHNNWSFGTPLRPTFFKPGENPAENHLFLLALTSVIKGLDMHQDILRQSISGASNDHRLGANEAPPAIMSTFLGASVHGLVQSIIKGTPPPDPVNAPDLGIPYLPNAKRDNTDRNRTSPFAFTGNKFEVRAGGSSQRLALTNTALNVLAADALEKISDEIIEERKNGASVDEALQLVIRRNLEKHQRIIFEGDGYSDSWKEEAADRGLLNLVNTVDTLEYFDSEKNRELFERHHVLNRNEFQSNLNVDYDNYSLQVNIEAQSTLEIANRYIIPTATKSIGSFSRAAKRSGATQVNKRLDQLISYTESAILGADMLDDLHTKQADMEGHARAKFHAEQVIPAMAKVRESLDRIENITDAKDWPLPTYREMLFKRT
eukprot:TRINITY_DN4103_c0_g1_i2.p1 TRINITY_DN4103_c0_g1~~TRINITY_DN4103_c0_g1_i2.p1  ORF type:complete len:749 (-),score=189.86 TRINITY_DN4103_c0_g1_i2:134-2317(-)